MKRYLYTSLRFFLGISMVLVGVFTRQLEADSTPGGWFCGTCATCVTIRNRTQGTREVLRGSNRPKAWNHAHTPCIQALQQSSHEHTCKLRHGRPLKFVSTIRKRRSHLRLDDASPNPRSKALHA